MKKKVFSLMMMLLLAVTGFVRADELTVHDGTATDGYVPVYGYYADAYLKCEMVYPASELSVMNGAQISSLKFYATQADVAWGAANFQVFVAEVANEQISAFAGPGTVVYDGALSISGGEMLVNFTTPYTYNGGNLLVGVYNTIRGTYVTSTWYGESVSGASVQGYSYSSLASISASQRGFLPKTTFTYNGGGGGGGEAGLHVKYMDGDVEVVDRLDLGVRPAGAWMEPFNFTMYAEGANYIVNVLDFTPDDGLFTVAGEELPFQVIPDEDVALNIVTNGTEAGVIERQFVAITEGDRAAHIWPVTVEFYAPEIPDVWEKACTEATTFPFVEVPASAHHIVLHNDYTLPFPEIPEGEDAVYKLVFDHDVMLNAEVTVGENGKVALYREGFEGEGGPMATNNYTGIGMGGSGAAAGPFEAQIGEGTSTTGYFPFYTLYNFSIAENLFLAAELEAAGVTTAPMTSLSWYATNTTGYNQQGITIWMANVDDETLTTTSHVVTGMTKVYTGAMTPVVGWNEFVFNEGNFAWDGSSNILIYCQRNNGEWNSTVYWEATPSLPFDAMAYRYQDSGAYDATAANPMYTSTTRPNIIMKSDGRSRESYAYNFETDLQGWTNIDNDGDTYGWVVATDLYTGVEGYGANGSDNFAMGFSYVNTESGGFAFDCDDYLVSPQAYAIGNNASLSFYHDQLNASYPDYMEVCISTAATPAPSNFTAIWNNGGSRRGNGQGGTREAGFNRLGTWTQQTLNLSAYAGQNVWIAFHHQAYDQFAVLLDDVTVNTGNSGPNPPTPPTPPTPTPSDAMSYGPVIENAAVEPGTYYLVASSTTPNFEVTINAEEMPCPTVEEFAFNPIPADNADGIEPASVTLQWMIPDYATGWRLIFGSTYHPEIGHPQTVIYPEDGSFTNNMANSYTVRNLWNNTNYFWRVEFNNDGCPEGVSSPVWGFTTHLNVPQNLRAADETVFNDEQISLSWNAVVDRTYRMYNVYRDGELIGHTQVNNIGNTTYLDDPQPYNMAGYHYYVTAVYDEGESAPSNVVIVKVSGRGNVEGHVYEQDGTTGIAGATVTMVGPDEFGVNHTYNFTTNAQGYYTGAVYAGLTYDGQAGKDGYQTDYVPEQGEPIAVNYNQTASPYDYILDENFDPVCSVVAQYYPDSTDINAPYVKVFWGCGLPGEEIVEDFETGDFSKYDWQLDGSYPWSITTNNPYEGTYCMKSGGAGVASVTSNMTVTVDIPADGDMSFFARISSESNYDYGHFYIDGVEKYQASGAGNWVEKTYPVTQGTHTFQWRYTKDSSVNTNDDCFYVDYITFYRRPEPPMPGTTYDFEDSSMQGWTSVDADGDGYGWEIASSIMSGQPGHDGSNDFVISQSYYGGIVLYPDNYLVSPQVELGGTLRFYACAQDASYAAEHFGVAVSTTNTNPSSFTMLQEWTMTAKGISGSPKMVKAIPSAETPQMGHSRDGNTRVQGNWYEYTVDLSAYSGMGYVAIRHFQCSDMFYLNVDDITIGEPGRAMSNNDRSLDHYRVYRTNCYNDGPYTEENTVLLATVWVPDTVYIDVEWADLPAGVYKWGVGAVYAGNRGEEIAGPINWSEPVSINNATREAFNYGFEGGLEGWTVLDAPGSEVSWVHSNNNPGGYDYTVLAHGGTGFAMGYSFVDYDGAYNIDSYLVSPQKYSIGDGSSISFWADNANDSYPENFSICVATAANPTIADFTTVWSGAAKGSTGIKAESRHDANRYENWRSHSVDLSAYAGQEVWIAFHDVNYDAYEVWIDDVTINAGGGSGPVPPTPPTPGTGGLQLPRESEIVWSNCLDKDMYLGENDVDITVLLNSADSPEGVTVSFVNLNEAEQELYPVADVVLDETGYYAWDTFRKGNYEITITKDGYETIVENVDLWNPASLRYVMIEIIYGVDNLYVSRTGWAMWEGHGDPVNPTPGPTPGGETTFIEGFEGGLNGWTVIDAAGSEATWLHSNNNPGGYDYTVLAHGGTGFALGYSFVDYDGAYNIDSYLVTPQKYTITANSHLTFWADNANDSYPESFSVCVATVDNPTPADFTQVWSGNAKANAGQKANVRHDENRYENWRSHNVDLSAYAGQEVWIAFHDVNYDAYEIWIDDVELTAGAKNGGDRHLEYYKVMCESIDHEPIFNINTPHNFCQVATDQLVEGEQYICKVAAVYSTGMSDYAECVWEYESCENYAGTVNGLEVNGTTVSWEYPNTPGPGPGPGPQPGENALVVLSTPVDIWGDGSGYQMFLDADHTVAAGLPTGNFGGSIPAETVAEFEYRIPENADGNVNGQNVISAPGTNMGSVEVPAGMYDILVVNPDGSNVWVVGTGGQYTGITDDFTFEAGKTYTFTVVGSTSGDGLDLVVTDTRGNVVAVSNNGRIVRITDGRFAESVGAKSNRAPWDLMFTFYAAEAAHYGVVTDGTNFYTSNWGYSSAAHNFYKYDMQGNMIEGFEIPGCGTLRGMTYDGTYFYGVANSSTVYCVDLANHSVVSTFTTSYGAMRGITYDPTRDGFWVIGNWSGNLTLIDRTGAIVQVGPEPTSASDLAYYKDENDVEHVFCFNNGDNGVYDYNITNNQLGGSVFNFSNVPGFSDGTSGGCHVAAINGKMAFIGDLQQDPNLIGVYELRDAGTGPTPPPTPSGDVLGAMVFLNGEWEAFVPAPTNSYEFPSAGEYCVRIVYNGTAELPSNNFYYAMSCEECEGDVTPTCEPGDPIHAEVLGATDQVRIWWGIEPAAPIEEWLYYDDGDLENASLLGLGGNMTWAIMFSANDLQAYNGCTLTEVAVMNGLMEDNTPGVGNFTANIYLGGDTAPGTLVSTQTITANGTLDWLYGTLDTPVTLDMNQNLWIVINQVGITYPAVCTATSCGNPNARWIQYQGSWYDIAAISDYSVDWFIRGFVTNQRSGKALVALPDNTPVSTGTTFVQKTGVDFGNVVFGNRSNRASIVKYNVYRSDDATGTYTQIGEVAEAGQTLYEYFDTPDVAGMYYYQVTAVYDDGCESAPALAADDPTHNYVSASVDAIGENSDNVALYPNPTKGNVTIEANGMSRITVVSVLGQVVYDTELNADVYTLNMSQFNAGMYMVRIYTENGVTVKRVTVMQ